MNSEGYPTRGQSLWLNRLPALPNQRTAIPVKGISLPQGVAEMDFSGSPVYSKKIKKMAATGRSLKSILCCLQISEAQETARELWPVYRESLGLDGYVTVEPASTEENDTIAIIREAFYTWRKMGRANAMISLPALHSMSLRSKG